MGPRFKRPRFGVAFPLDELAVSWLSSILPLDTPIGLTQPKTEIITRIEPYDPNDVTIYLYPRVP